MRCILFLIGSLIFLASCAQDDTFVPLPEIQTVSHQLGDKKITISISSYGNNTDRFFLLKLHDNEQTAGEAADLFLRENGGKLLNINNNKERYIEFNLKGRLYRFDPNRMFTPTGVRKSLEAFHSYSANAATEIGKFADRVLSLIPDSLIVIAVHNNTDSEYSLLDYLEEGKYQKDVDKVYWNNKMDADDFVFTTDSGFYNLYFSQEISTVLQANSKVKNDGSLSVYFGQKSRAYLNVEAEHGHLEEQLRMLKVLLRFKEETKSNH